MSRAPLICFKPVIRSVLFTLKIINSNENINSIVICNMISRIIIDVVRKKEELG